MVIRTWWSGHGGKRWEKFQIQSTAKMLWKIWEAWQKYY